jgi:hypothetical protein
MEYGYPSAFFLYTVECMMLWSPNKEARFFKVFETKIMCTKKYSTTPVMYICLALAVMKCFTWLAKLPYL